MRPCLKRGARALFDFRLRFQISDFDFQSAIPGLFWGLAPFDLWYLSKQSGNTVAILYGVNPCGDRRDRLAARFHPALVGAQQMRNRNFLIHHRINSSSHLIPLPERDRSKRGHAIRTALPSDAPHARRRSA